MGDFKPVYLLFMSILFVQKWGRYTYFKLLIMINYGNRGTFCNIANQGGGVVATPPYDFEIGTPKILLFGTIV